MSKMPAMFGSMPGIVRSGNGNGGNGCMTAGESPPCTLGSAASFPGISDLRFQYVQYRL